MQRRWVHHLPAAMYPPTFTPVNARLPLPALLAGIALLGACSRPPEPQRAPKPEQKSTSKTNPKGKPQQERDRPSNDDKGRDKKHDDPQAPKGKPQQEPGRPSTGDKKDDEEAKGKKKKKVEG